MAGPGPSLSVARPMWPEAVPTAGTGATVAASGWWPIATRRPSTAFGTIPTAKRASGSHGMGKGRHGKAGADLDVPVPEGTVVRDAGGEVIADLVVEGDRWLAARGGQGGRGNARFLSNRRRAPAFAEQAELGEERWLDLEIKLMADVALVGFPNSGKSTLISRISAARPKIADYPFTTLEPHLGVVRFDDQEFVVADIPGLIEGASDGRGLGHRFLRHIERARALLILVDLTQPDGRTPSEQQRILLEELRRHQPDLLARPRLLVGSKLTPRLRMSVGTASGFLRSQDEGLRPLLGRMASEVDAGQGRATPSAPLCRAPAGAGRDCHRAIVRRRLGSTGPACRAGGGAVRPDQRGGSGLRPGSPAPARGGPGPGPGRSPKRRPGAHRRVRVRLPARR